MADLPKPLGVNSFARTTGPIGRIQSIYSWTSTTHKACLATRLHSKRMTPSSTLFGLMLLKHLTVGRKHAAYAMAPHVQAQSRSWTKRMQTVSIRLAHAYFMLLLPSRTCSFSGRMSRMHSPKLRPKTRLLCKTRLRLQRVVDQP